MKFDSLAMIETNGLVSALVAVDKMLSLGNVKFLKKEVISNGQVTIFIIGNASEIKRVLHAGIIAAQNVGAVISSGIVPYPNDEIEKIIFESATSASKLKKVRKSVKKEENIETLFNQFKDETSFHNLMAKERDINPDVAGDVLLIKQQKKSDATLEDETSNKLNSDKKDVIDSNEDVLNTNIDNKIENNDANKIVEPELERGEDDETSEKKSQENIEEISEDKRDLEGMSHLERLRAEAKLEIQSEIGETSITNLDEVKTENNNVELTTAEISDVKSETEENLDSELYRMSVPELRKLARSKENFPIKGREISKANRKVLLDCFAQLK